MNRSNRNKGCLVVVEGVTGAGKTYFVEKLEAVLSAKMRLPVLKMGGFINQDQNDTPPITKFLRDLMKASRFIGLPWLAETTILLAEQAYNVERYVLPAYAKGSVILYENYNDALVAYQLMRGQSLPVTQEVLLRLLRNLVNMQYKPFGYPRPDLTVYLKSPLLTICTRLRTREPRPVSKKDKASIEAIAKNYERMYTGSKGVTRVLNHADTDLRNESSSVAARIAAIYQRKCQPSR